MGTGHTTDSYGDKITGICDGENNLFGKNLHVIGMERITDGKHSEVTEMNEWERFCSR